MKFTWIKIEVICLLAVIGSLSASAQATNYPRTVLNFLTGIDSVTATLKMELNTGIFYKQINEQEIFLEINSETISKTELQLTGSKIKLIKYSFPRPLVFSDAGLNGCDGVSVSAITLKENSVSIDYKILDKTARYIRRDKKIIENLQKSFNLTAQLSGLIDGNIFGYKELSIWRTCGFDFRPTTLSKSIVDRISISTADEKFNISFKENWKIFFNNAQDFDNYLITGTDNNLEIRELESRPESGAIRLVCVGGFKKTKEASLESTGLNVKIKEPVFENLVITMQHSKENSSLVRVESDMNGSFYKQSGIDISSDNTTNRLKIDDGSTISVQNLFFESTDGQTKVRFGPNSDMKLLFSNSAFSFNKLTSVGVRTGKISKTSLTAEFDSKKKTTFWQGTFFGVDFNLQDGIISLNDDSRLQIESGKILADRLEINNSFEPQITGVFTKFSLLFKNSNIFSAPNSNFKIEMAKGSYLSQDANDPVKLQKDEPYPLGALNIHFEFSRFEANEKSQLSLTTGKMEGKYKYIGKGQFTFRDLNIQAKLNLMFQDKAFHAIAKITDGRLDFSRTMLPDFEGTATFTVEKFKDEIVFESPCMQGDEIEIDHAHDKHLYPVKFLFSLNKEVVFPHIKISIKKGIVQSFNSETESELTVRVPEGYGEYDADHDDCNEIHSNIHNQDRGPEDIRKMQEAFRLDVDVRNCTFHVFLKDKSYQLPFSLKFEYNISKEEPSPIVVIRPNVRLSAIKLDYVRIGCSDFLTAGALSLLVGDVDKLIEKQIQSGLDKFSDRFSQMITLPLN